MRKFTYFLVLIFTYFLQTKVLSQNLFDASNTALFARYLEQTGDYLKAAHEYDRLYFMEPNDSTLVKVLHCYGKAQKFDICKLKMAERYAKGSNNVPHFIVNSYYNTQLWTRDSEKFKEALQAYPTSDLPTLNECRFKVDMLEGNWLGAFKSLQSDTPFSTAESQKYAAFLQNTLAQKQLSTFKSMALSTLVPGLGKVYLGNWKDGVMSFLLTAGSAFQSYRNFQKIGPNSTLGYIFGGMSLGFYVGNIVGTKKESIKRKKLQHEQNLAKAYLLIDTD